MKCVEGRLERIMEGGLKGVRERSRREGKGERIDRGEGGGRRGERKG